jgi:uncharacterized cupin superfamily protein
VSESDIAFGALDRDGSERFQTLRRDLGVHSFGMNLMILRPGQRGRIHAHSHQEEVYLVLEGELSLILEGAEHLLGADRIARIGPAVRRQLANAGKERVVVLALGGAGEHSGRDGLAWASWEEHGAGRAPQEVPLPSDLEL